MIPRAGIKQFLERFRDDHRWIKRLSADELDHEVERHISLAATKLRLHQKACFLLGVAFPKFGYWVDMGGGKTLLSLLLLRYWYDRKLIKRGLILVTSDKAYLTWQRQLVRFGIGLPYVFLDGTTKNKWDQLEDFGNGLVIVHYPGLVAMLTKTVGKRWDLDERLIAQFIGKFQGVVFDESTRLGNEQSLTYRIGQLLAERCHCVYALAGRPFGRDPTLVWSQYKLLDGGATFGESIGLFRAAFFSKSERRPGKFLFKKRMMKQLTRMLQHRSITYATEEMPDLPPLERTSILEEVRLPEEAEIYYNRLVDQIIEAKGNVSLMKNAFIRLRQVSSGFIAVTDDDTGERIEVQFDANPKMDRLLELIDELPDKRKAVIFYEFTHSGRMITNKLQEKGLDPVWLWSGTKHPTDELRRFLDDPECTVAVINSKVGAYSLDGLQEVANYVMFYESPVSVLDREQASCRVLRQGQPLHVFEYDLVVRDTVDHKILDFHREGRDLYAAMINDTDKIVHRRQLAA